MIETIINFLIISFCLINLSFHWHMQLMLRQVMFIEYLVKHPNLFYQRPNLWLLLSYLFFVTINIVILSVSKAFLR